MGARLLFGVATIQFILAVPAWATLDVSAGAGRASVVWIPLIGVAFLVGGSFLLVSGRDDRRAVHLGGVFGGVVAAFSATPARLFGATLVSPWASLGHGLLAIRVEAFLPFFLWAFAGGFPRARSPWDGVVRTGTRATLFIGVLLLLLHLADGVVSLSATSVAPMLRFEGGDGYWGVLFFCALPALAVLPLRIRSAPLAERRRARLLLTGVVLGGAPIVIFGLLDVFGRIPDPAWSAATGWIVYPALASVPLSTAYAVLVTRALDVRLVVRRALQYALARYTLIGLGLGPPLALAVVLFLNRERAVGELFFGPRALPLLLVSLASVGLLRVRQRLMIAIDRRFFRDQYDAQRILGILVREAREATSPAELERSLTTRVAQALHPHWSDLLLVRSSDAWLVSSRRSAPLAPGSRLVAALIRAGKPLEAREARGLADASETDWLERYGVDLLVPMVGSGRNVLGILMLGRKRSELPYTTEDRSLLALAAEAVALRLDGLSDDSAESAGDLDAVADECIACGGVQPAGDRHGSCRLCGESLTPALLPIVVADKLAVVRRLGAGGRGRAYLAEDRTLGRRVALKVLAARGSGATIRLTREARALAAVSHPHVASVYSLEHDAGRSVLVLEYLPGGTLADRLRTAPIPAGRLAVLVDQLARGLSHLHDNGVLHRDVKPSNIGFTHEGSAKLLDFGQVSLGPAASSSSMHSNHPETLAGDPLPGTVGYMSPEALAGLAPGPGDDLWALAVVTWESATRIHPFEGHTAEGTIGRILAGGPPRWDEHAAPEYGELGEVLIRALSPDPSNRFSEVGAFSRAVARAVE